MKKRVLVLADVDLSCDARIQRQLTFLRGDYDVDCLCRKASPVEGVTYLELGLGSRPAALEKLVGAALSAFGVFGPIVASKPFYRLGLSSAAGKPYDLVIANDVDTMPLALGVAAGCGAKVLLDAHEYAPAQFDNSLRWRLTSGRYMRYLTERCATRADGAITVCDAIARLYRERFGIDASVLTNAPEYSNLEPGPVDRDAIRLIYHGAVNPNRRIENMYRVLDALPERYSLAMMVTNPDSPYGQELRAAAGPRVKFVPPVEHGIVARAINGYDIGLYLLEPRNDNQRFALPNKFFEFVQGRLAVAVGPSDEMAAYVKHYDLGAVSPDFSPAALASRIASLGADDIARCKRNAHKAALELNAEANKGLLLAKIEGMLAGRPDREAN
jgi:glycosyltransferase involved in cell wall biosynthesis